MNDICDDDPEKTYSCVAKKLSDLGLAYLHVVNPDIAAIEQKREQEPRALRMLHLLRKKYHGKLILAGGFDHETAEQWLQEGKAT